MYQSLKAAILWIDWYPYHVARFRALAEHSSLRGRVVGLELVGGSGVHRGLIFRTLNRAGMRIETLLPGMSWTPRSQALLTRLVWRKLDQLKPEAVLVPGYSTAPAVAAALWAKWNRKRSVLMTESTESDHRRVPWREFAKSKLVRALFDCAIAGGRRHANYLLRLGVAPSQIRGFYDVVDNSEIQAQTDMLRLVGREASDLPRHYFLYVGRFAPEKNLGVLIKAFAAYRDRGGDRSLVLVGAGPDFDELKRLAMKEGVANMVQFPGQKSDLELARYYAFADCFVLPSTREPWGLVVNEAMAAGLPVIVSRACGCADDLVSHGVNGFIFDPQDELQLAHCLSEIATADVTLHHDMSRASRDRISAFSLERWSEEVFHAVSDPGS